MEHTSPYRAAEADLQGAPWSDVASLEISGLLHPAVRVGLVAAVWWLFLTWFGYDGWLNRDTAMQEHQVFNRVLFGVLLAPSILLAGAVRRVAVAAAERRSNRSAVVVLSPEGGELRVATMPWLWTLHFSGLNLLLHKSAQRGLLCFLGSMFTANLVSLGFAFFARGIVERAYAEDGWHVL